MSRLLEWLESTAVRLLPSPVRRPLRPMRRAVHRRRVRRETPASATRLKQGVIRDYGRAFHTPVLVETGTFLGDTVHAMRRRFRTIYSIELSEILHAEARERFAGVPNVVLLQGDSAAVLPRLAREIADPCLFWLDGHWAQGITALGATESPLRSELRAVLARTQPDVILIDDAAYLNGQDGYPTFDEIRGLAAAATGDLSVEVAADIVRIHPWRSEWAPSH